VLTLLLLLLFLLVVVSIVSRATRRRRRALEEQARREEEARRGTGPVAPESMSPFDLFPFGGLLESMMTGMGARSFRYDERTGEWVEVIDEALEPEPHQESDSDREQRERRRRVRKHPRTTSSMPFGGLMGSMGGLGGGSGEFDVEPPDELQTFADVGGMEELKEEVRGTVGLLLQHPDDADRYGID
jgi:hypothetical protein